MPLSFPSKQNKNAGALFPLDFFRFKHTMEVVPRVGAQKSISKPLWVVGDCPFDEEAYEDEGYIIHLGTPRFTARWSMNEEQGLKTENPSYYDEDLNMALYDVELLEGEVMPSEEWFIEAACAVGYSKGLIAMAPSEDAQQN